MKNTILSLLFIPLMVFADTPPPVLQFAAPLSKTGKTVSIPAATPSVNGYLSSTDWTTFNGKQDAGTASLISPGIVTTGAQTLAGNKTFSTGLLIPDGENQYHFTITTQQNVTVHTGDVYSDGGAYGTGLFTVVTPVTLGTSFTVTGNNRPQGLAEAWTKISGSGGSFASFQIQNYIDDVSPQFGFASEPKSGLIRFGANDWGLALNGQTIMEFGTSTYSGVTGNVVTIGKSVYPSDPDSIFNVVGTYPDVLKMSLLNYYPNASGAGLYIGSGLQIHDTTTISLENFSENNEYAIYLQNTGVVAAHEYLKSLNVVSDNHAYTFTFSTPVSLTQGATFTDSADDTFIVDASTDSSSTANMDTPLFPSPTYWPASTSGTLTCVSRCSGNLTYTTVSPMGYIAFDVGGRYSYNEVLRMNYQQISFQAPLVSGVAGSASQPAYGFNWGGGIGMYQNSNLDLAFAVNAYEALDVKYVSANQVNVGMGVAASSSQGYPLTSWTSYNGTSKFQLQNANQSASSASVLQLLAGAYDPSYPKFTTVSLENYGYNSGATFGAVLSSGTNVGSAMLITNEWAYSGATIALALGGRDPGNFALQITPTAISAMNSALFQLKVQGSGTTPTCGSSANGSIALTHLYILCVCNGSGWVKTSDGSTSCTF